MHHPHLRLVSDFPLHQDRPLPDDNTITLLIGWQIGIFVMTMAAIAISVGALGAWMWWWV